MIWKFGNLKIESGNLEITNKYLSKQQSPLEGGRGMCLIKKQFSN